MAKAIWNGAVLAESDATRVVEGNHYFPPESVNRSCLKPSSTESLCPWKGMASYYTVQVDGAVLKDAGWFYRDPSPKAAEIKDHVAFWKGVEIVA